MTQEKKHHHVYKQWGIIRKNTKTAEQQNALLCDEDGITADIRGGGRKLRAEKKLRFRKSSSHLGRAEELREINKRSGQAKTQARRDQFRIKGK